MNTALAVFAHALRMLLHDPAATLRVLLPPTVLVALASVGIGVFAPDVLTLAQATPETVVLPNVGTLLLALALLTIALVGYALMAILWHRYVLLQGDARETQLRPDTGVVLGYLWRATVLGLVQILIGVPALLVFAMLSTVGATLPAVAAGVALVLLTLGLGLFLVWVGLRLSLVLPAAALGEHMLLSQSWQATQPLSGPLWAVAAIVAAISMVFAWALNGIAADAPAFSIALKSVAYIIEGLIFISILTTLYGHLIQRRPLG